MNQIFCTITDKSVKKIDSALFFALEKYIIDSGLGADKDSFETIKERLHNPPILSANEFAEECIYVILAGGFRQKIAKRKFGEIMDFIYAGGDVCEKKLLPIFGNVNKIRAIIKIWNNSKNYRNGFYELKTDAEKLTYLATLPHIGEITKNHIARNLGINVVKHDVWIQRLESVFGDKMFAQIEKATGLNRGYIDVVLWKACQIGILKFL
ncbi:MAG: hypothetical protein FWC15_04515 [Fibromonadales bacterium]|nr:hypothetical protein [Fibromonadales bacterium]